MRLWHKDLIAVLPRQQLLAQWRECVCIARNIEVNSTPNHILVNKVLDYDLTHLYAYGRLVRIEMIKRGYKVSESAYKRFTDHISNYSYAHGYREPSLATHTAFLVINPQCIYNTWHNHRYLTQCLYNLEEKYDCGGITEEEWNKIETHVQELYVSQNDYTRTYY